MERSVKRELVHVLRHDLPSEHVIYGSPFRQAHRLLSRKTGVESHEIPVGLHRIRGVRIDVDARTLGKAAQRRQVEKVRTVKDALRHARFCG